MRKTYYIAFFLTTLPILALFQNCSEPFRPMSYSGSQNIKTTGPYVEGDELLSEQWKFDATQSLPTTITYFFSKDNVEFPYNICLRVINNSQISQVEGVGDILEKFTHYVPQRIQLDAQNPDYYLLFLNDDLDKLLAIRIKSGLSGFYWIAELPEPISQEDFNQLNLVQSSKAIEVGAYRLSEIDSLNPSVASIDNAPNIIPANLVLPVINGSSEVGQALIATQGSWTGRPRPTYSYQWLKNGTAISGATNATFVVSSSDVNATLRVRVTATNLSGSSSVQSPGILVAPSSSGKIWNVTNSAALLNAMKNSLGGDTIVLAGGVYSRLSAANMSKASRVSIVAASRTNPPLFTTNGAMTLANIKNFTFDGLVFRGTNYIEKNGSKTFPAVGSVALKFDGISDVTFRNVTWDYWGISVTTGAGNVPSKNLLFEYCRITRRAQDGMRFYKRVEGLTVRRCLFDNDLIDFSRSSEDNRHPDAIQGAVTGEAKGSIDVLIEQNKFVLGDGYTQTVFFRNRRVDLDGATADDIFYKNFMIRNNDIMAPAGHCISASGIKNMQIIGNRIRETPGGFSQRPRVNFGLGVFTVHVENNTGPVPPGIWPEGGSLKNVTELSNIWNTTSAVPAGWVDPTNLVGPYAYE